MIRAVFFDVDNTLLSFSGHVKETMQNGFAQFGLPPYQESMFTVFKRINNGLWKQLEEGALSYEKLISVRWNLVFQELKIPFDGIVFENYFRKRLFHSAVLEPGVMEVLDYLKPKYTLCIASNGPYEQQINRLRVGKLYDYFSHFFVSERIGVSKPNKAFFDACFNELYESGLRDLLPEEVMMIGDSISSDIGGGKACGLQTCLYHPGGSVISSKPDSADYVISELSEIRKIL